MSTLGEPVRTGETPLGAIRVAGVDARSFLQGQLSNDVRNLTRGNTLLAALNTPQGRVVAVMRLIERSEGIYALLPASLVENVTERLRKYVLRSKVTLTPATDLQVVPLVGIAAQQATADHSDDGGTGTHVELGDVSLVRPAGSDSLGDNAAATTPRALAMGPAQALTEMLEERQVSAASWNEWRLAQFAASEPQVYPATSERYVAQMLNLDLINALSFSKGCYTGQEIIVRTQHLGRIKRRMVRLLAQSAEIEIGSGVAEGDNSVGEVIDSAKTPAGTELLAIIQTSALAANLNVSTPSSATRIPVSRLPLAYNL